MRLWAWFLSNLSKFLVWAGILGVLLYAAVNNQPQIIIGWLDANLWMLKQVSALWPAGGRWFEAALRGSGFDRGIFVTVDAFLLRVLWWAVRSMADFFGARRSNPKAA